MSWWRGFLSGYFGAKATNQVFCLTLDTDAQKSIEDLRVRTRSSGVLQTLRLSLLAVDEQTAFIDGGGVMYAKYPGKNELVIYDPRLEPGLTPPSGPKSLGMGRIIEFHKK